MRSCWCLLESFEGNGGPLGSQRGPRLPKVRFLSHFGLLLGALGEPVWGHFAPRFPNRRDYVDFLVPFFRSQKKKRQQGSKVGGGHAIHPRRRMFREGRPSSLWLRFGLHFGVILEAKFATILLFGCAGPYFWVILEPFKTRVALGASECPRDRLRHTGATLGGRGGGPDWKVSQPQGEDNRRGTNTSHTPHDPKGSADLREFVKLPSSWPWRVGKGPPTSGS